MPKSQLDILNESSSEGNQILFDLSPVAIMIVDSKGITLAVNKKLLEWSGYSSKELVGIHVAKLPYLSQKTKLFVLSQFTKRIAGKNIEPYEIEVIAKDKSIKIGRINASVIKDKNGKNIADLVMVSDITETKKYEDQLVNKSQELEKLNKLMIGREEKMSELKEKLDNKKIASSSSFINLFKKRFTFQIMLGFITGVYVSLSIILFFTTNVFLALFIILFITLLCSSIIFTSLLLQRRLHTHTDKDDRAMLNLIEDTNEEKNYKEGQSKQILKNIREAIVITNEKGLVEYVNPSFTKLFECQLDKEIIGQDFAETVVMLDLKRKEIPVYERSDSASITAKDQEMQVILECKKGGQKVITINSSPVRINDEFKGVVRIIHDSSEKFGLQQQKDDFFSIASHELRTPLTVIAGNIDTVLQGYGKSKLSKDDTSLLHDVESATNRLIKMVNEFLNVSRIDQGRLRVNIAQIDACKVVEDVVKEIKPLTDKKNLYLEYTCPKDHVTISADEGLLKEIIINLIGNSIKFTKEGGIKVNLKVEKNFLIATISDTGIGIAQDKQKALFARFQQAMNRTLAREAGGTGLGLYISREFAHIMGGDLVLETSIEGEGSTFSLSVPLPKSDKK